MGGGNPHYLPGVCGFLPKKAETVKKAILGMIEHLALGKSVKSYYYEEGEEVCSWLTVVTYMKDEQFLKDNGLTFIPEHKTVAKAKGYKIWEKITEDSAKGINPTANTASLQMIMRNKFGWDKSTNHLNADNDEDEKQTIDPRLDAISKQLEAAKIAVTSLQAPSKDTEG